MHFPIPDVMRLVWENETVEAKKHRIAALMQSATTHALTDSTVERVTMLLYANAH